MIRRFGITDAAAAVAAIATLAAGCVGASKSASPAPPVTPQRAWPISTNAPALSEIATRQSER